MAIDLTPRWENFAVYLPAMQHGFATTVDNTQKNRNVTKNREFPNGINLADLDFLNPKTIYLYMIVFSLCLKKIIIVLPWITNRFYII